MSPFMEPQDEIMPIAVVGMSFRGPGDATNVENLLKMVAEGRESRSKIPKHKWNHEAFYHPDPSRYGSHNVEYGHWFQQDVTRFDAPFFNMTAAEAAALDPQQRMLLECTYEAMENSGTHMPNFVGTETSVFVGSFCTDYADVLWRDPETVPMYQCTNAGHSRANTANRISYSYDLKGPSVTVDTACSASLVALHLGCQSLLTGDAKQAIVAGSSAILSHEGMVTMSMMRLLSHEGRCYTFDERANGYARGDGVGVIFLKPLQDAVEAGDTIRAVIRGTGSNQDGKTPGITMPNGLAQEALIRHVYDRSGLDPLDTSYVECHGTGTQAGDTTETGALSRVFSPGRDEDDPLTIGSVKTNVGHLEGASGVTGVIKTILMLENSIILPNRNFQKANPRIPLKDWKLRVPIAIEPWSRPKPLRASVNSFGYGGANAHVIIESARDYLLSHGYDPSQAIRKSSLAVAPIQRAIAQCGPTRSGDDGIENGLSKSVNGNINGVNGIDAHEEDRARVFTLSAFDQAAGKGWVAALTEYLKQRRHIADEAFLDSLTYTLNERRTIHPWKATVIARSVDDLCVRLEGVHFVNVNPKQNLGFVFTGQGAQWCGMGKELIAIYPRFRKSLVACAAALERLGAPFDLLAEFEKDSKDSQINRALYSQPLCTALQIALVDLLGSWGIRPASVTGHSSGEIASAYTAGALSIEDAMLVSYSRGVASNDLASKGLTDGSMVAVGMSKEEALPILSSLSSGKAGVACSNSPSSITVSGDRAAIEELQAILEEKKIFNRKLVVEVAYHSHHMALVADQYRIAMSNIEVLKGNGIKFFSSVTGEQADISTLGPDYWVSNMVGEVKFNQSLHRLSSESGASTTASRKRNKLSPVHTLVEIGPHSALAGPIKQILQADDKLAKASIDYHTALARKKDAVESVLGLVSGLFVSGYSVDLSGINKLTMTKCSPLIDLPPYSWNHANSYSAESRISKFYRDRTFPRVDLLGVLERNSSSLEPRWRNHIRLSEIPWVHDHKIQSNIVYPAAGYITMAVEAAYQRAVQRSVTKIIGYRLREVVIGSALVVPENLGEVEVAITLKSFSESVKTPSDLWDEFVISSVTSDSRWTEHCRGLISVQTPQKSSNLVDGPAQEEADKKLYAELIKKYENNCRKEIDVSQFYDELTALGLEYGPTFANLRHLRSAPGECIGKIEIPDTAAVMPMQFQYPFVIHPATFDSFLHTIFVALAAQLGNLNDPAVPVSVDEVFIAHDISKKPGDVLNTYTSTSQKDYRYMSASIAVFGGTHEPANKPVVEIHDLTCATLERDGGGEADDEVPSRAYNLKWGPDVDLLSVDQLTKMCAAPPPPNAAFIRSKLERAAFYYLHSAVAAMSKASTPSAESDEYRQTLRGFLSSQVEFAMTKHHDHGWSSASESEKASLIEEVRASSGVGRTLCYAGEQLAKVVAGESSPSDLVQGLDFNAFVEDPHLFQNTRSAATYLDLVGHKNPNLSILTIGPQSGLASLGLLSLLSELEGSTPRFTAFHHTDSELNITDTVKEKFSAWANLIEFKDLAIHSDQSEENEVYDVVVAFHVLGSSNSLPETFSSSRRLLKPGGKLLLVGRALKSLVATVLWGSLPNVLSNQKHNEEISTSNVENLIQGSGFSISAALSSSTNKTNYGALFLSLVDEKPRKTHEKKALIIAEKDITGATLEQLRSQLSQSCIEVDVVSLQDARPTSQQACIILSEISSKVLADPSKSEWEAIKRLSLQSAGMIWVTNGAGSSLNPEANMAAGLLRTIRSETGDKPIITLDLEDLDGSVEYIMALFRHVFQSAVSPGEIDAEYTERSGILNIPRLVEDAQLTKHIGTSLQSKAAEIQPFDQPGRPLRMYVGTPGLLDTLHFTEDDRLEEDLPDDWVEMQIKASGINFKDVMMAMGQIKVENLGWECSGILTAVGKHVKGLKIGDRVVCHGSGTFATHSRGPAANAMKIPDNVTFETAAALPVTYVTAYHSIHNVARLQPGETILVHAATGGLGQAIVELCKLVGAEIFVTVGTPEKKRFVQEHFHIPEDHILWSRDNSFAKAVKRLTNGKGVDVVMNSLAGELLRLSWECIAPYGRFVELGQRDITVNSRLEMSHFARNASFTAFNLAYMVQYNPEVANDVFARVLHLFAQGAVKGPSPVEVYPFSQMEAAFRRMQTGGHMGKLVAVSRPGDMVKVIAQDKSKNMFRPDASYLLVGGLGGIGRATSQWMVQHGAKNIIFVNRSGLKTDEAKETVRVLDEAGCATTVFSCDITDAPSVEAFAEEAARSLPPIRGVIQGAMLLRDTMFEKMTLDDYRTVIRPKVHGTWNLHNFLPKDMDFFVMESSVSGIIGNTAQAAYAAGNTFLDAFASYRNSLGLPATTLDLGAISGVGYLAKNDELKQAMERQGFEFTDEKRLMRLIQFAIQNPRREGNLSHVITGLGTWQESNSLGALNTPMFSHFRRLASSGASSDNSANNLRKVLKESKTFDAASEAICDALVDKIASRSGLPIENVSTAKSMPDYGIDSLVAVELRNWIAKEMDSTIPILELMASDPLTGLAAKIAKRSRLVNVESGEDA
uniref:Highly reducing polyketide synthase phiA n=1 Tax=Fungal sp. (strain ATCC 74256) TaxID=1729595 RepID=PHIA_FUNX7|nr:RecName: Full=Highly reducing polyketide synthase phiA; Short=HR-PKS phiA; AltName: Full=Phomoidride biosynthesis cluster protein A [fungal sp. ATCC 74256]BBG28498.1 putative polyketide synthase [fungal sp. ATCC 74256]